MKKFALLISLILVIQVVKSQNVLRYEFINSLNEKNGNGPALSILGNQGSFVLDTLNEISGNTKTVYRFESNSGFQFDNAAADNFIGDTYSIEIYFVFDELTSWKRVVDWKNRKTDYGAYVYYGELNFYPYVYSGEAPVLPGEYTYYVITRNAAGQLFIYTDAHVQIDLQDTYGDALVDEDNVINFFQDDLAVPNEASAGAVALLNMYNYVLDSNAVKQNFNNIGGQVFSVKEIRKGNPAMNIYPNPASGQTTVELSGFKDQNVEIGIYNISGEKIFTKRTNSFTDHQIPVDISSFSDGIYLIRAVSKDISLNQKLVISR